MRIRSLKDVEACLDLEEAMAAAEIWIGWPYFGESSEGRAAMVDALVAKVAELRRSGDPSHFVRMRSRIKCPPIPIPDDDSRADRDAA